MTAPIPKVPYVFDGTNWNAKGRGSSTPTAPVQVTGAGYTRVQDISGGLTNAGATNVTFPPGITYIGSDFDDSAYPVYGCYVKPNVISLVGCGNRESILEVTPNSMSTTSAAKIPAVDAAGMPTNPLIMMRLDDDTYLNNVTVKATSQIVSGVAQFYRGVQSYYQTNAQHRDALIKGVPGYRSFPPGETSALEDYHGTNNNYTRIEVDGRDDNGTEVTALCFAANFSNGMVVQDSYLHHARWSYGIGFFNCVGHHVISNVRSEDNLIPFNMEQCHSMTVDYIDCTWLRPSRPVDGGSGTSVHLIVDSNLGSAVVNIHDPVFESIPGRTAGKFIVQRHTTYSLGAAAGTANTQLATDIHIFKNGVEQTGSARDAMMEIVT